MLAMTLTGPGGGGGGRPGGGGGRPGGGGGGMPGGGGRPGGGLPPGRFPGPRHPGPFHPYGRAQGRGFAPGGWWPNYYAYGPDVVVVQPATNCQFTLRMPSGEQITVTGTCPVPITGPVVATIAPLL